MHNNSTRVRAGFTLPELMASIFAFGILLTGLLSVLTVAIQTMNLNNGSSALQSKSFRTLAAIDGDLILAKQFFVRNDSVIEFSTDDRDGDGNDEIVRYEYFSSPRNEITKSIYYSATASLVEEVVATDVTEFKFETTSKVVATTEPVQARLGLEKLLFSFDLALDDLVGNSPSPSPIDSSGDSPVASPSSSPSPSTGGPAVNMDVADALSNAKTILLVVQDTASLTRHESSVKTLLESLNCVVRTINDAASQTDFDTEFPLCDMIYVPNIIDVAVAEKFRNTTIGVLSESNGVCERLGLGEASGNGVDGSYLELRQDSNALTDGNVNGAVPLFNSAQNINTLSGSTDALSEHIHIIGQTGDQVTNAYLESGNKAFLSALSPLEVYGYEDVYANQSIGMGWNHVGTRITVTDSAIANSISLYTRFSDSSVVRFGIYSDANGDPGSLLAHTNSGYSNAFSARWISMDLQSPTHLDPGTYWIVASVYGSVHFYFESGGSTRTCYSGTSVWDGMMSQWGSYQDYSYSTKLSMNLSCNVEENVAGRRMFVPWGGPSVDLDELTDAGRSIFSKAIQWCATPLSSANESPQAISSQNTISQYVLPEFDSSESEWCATRISLFVKPIHSDSSGNLRVSIYEPNDAQKPSDKLLSQSGWIPISQISGDHFRWFNLPIDPLPPQSHTTGLCIQIETDSTISGIEIAAEKNTALSNASLFQSADGGSSYNASSTSENAKIYIFGRTLSSK